jgi:hypothetical protein
LAKTALLGVFNSLFSADKIGQKLKIGSIVFGVNISIIVKNYTLCNVFIGLRVDFSNQLRQGGGPETDSLVTLSLSTPVGIFSGNRNHVENRDVPPNHIII